MPRVLTSDELNKAAINVFKLRGLDVDFMPGLKKDELLKIIGGYDGLAVRSATKAAPG